MTKIEHFESLDPLEHGDVIEIDLESNKTLTHPIRVRSVILPDSGEGVLVRLEDSQFRFLEQIDGVVRAVTSEMKLPVNQIVRREDAVPEPQTQLTD